MPPRTDSAGVPRSAAFARNLIYNVGGQVALMLLSFFLIPMLVGSLGKEGYALYGMMGIWTSYLLLLSFGSANSTLKFVSEQLARGDEKELAGTVRLSLLAHVGGVGLGALMVFALRLRLADWATNVPPHLREDAVFLLACVALGAVFASCVQFSIAIFQGFQRFGLSSLAGALQNGLVLAGAAMLAAAGAGVKGAGLWFAATQVSIGTLFLGVALGVLGSGRLARLVEPVPAAVAKRFSNYTVFSFLGQVAWSFTFQWDKVLIASFCPLNELTYYLIPSFLLQKFWFVPSSVSQTAFPLLSALSTGSDTSAFKKVYRQCSQLILWLVLPGFVLLFFLCPQFLTLWMGSDFSLRGVWPMRLLIGGYLFHFMALMPTAAVMGTGRPKWVLVGQSLQAAVSFCLWLVLIPNYGIAGAAAGFLAGQALVSLPFAWLVSRDVVGLSVDELTHGVALRPFAAAAALSAFLWLFRGQSWNWPGLIAVCAASTFLYYGIGYRLLGSEDRDTLRRLLGRASK